MNKNASEALTDFPPLPLSNDLRHDIMRQCCQRLHPELIEEAGCVVCGQLVLKASLVHTKSMKNHFGILNVPDIMRVERRNDSERAWEYKGAVLDHSADGVCEPCRGALYKNKMPEHALAKGTWLGEVPPVLQDLTFMEKMLIAHVRHTCAFVRISIGIRKMKANVIAFENTL
ncbi:hypothetical protein ARMGADRAFT_942354 [Armillaria gallica]|uniref:DUF6570 domain-containing protein n=1 Tax=Armillaria gallica TaxID=47427 RepID=A0A2H3CPW3_ARMGA|nr:hypothetical protein ARMGADRAFT_942354 [Armillaria gallica]